MTFYGLLDASRCDKRVFMLVTAVVCVIRLTSVKAIGNSSIDDDYTPWTSLLEDTTLSQSSRNGRILLPATNYVQHNTFSPSQYYAESPNQFIPANNYYFSNRLDNVETIEYDANPKKSASTTTATTNKPSTHPPPVNPQPYQNYQPIRQNNYQQNLVPSQREISETDLFLLSAIEKLTYKVDYMEKRLKKTEQLLYYIMEGNQAGDRFDEKPPCPNNFTFIGDTCYFIGIDRGLNWKSAAAMCKSLGGQLAELDPISRQKDVIFRLLNDFAFRGKDFWVGGLNPGLLWIWINSGKPVNPNMKLEKMLPPQRKSRIIVNDKHEIVPTTESAPIGGNLYSIDRKDEPISDENTTDESVESEGKVINGVYNKGPTTPNPKIINKPPTTTTNRPNLQQNFKDDQIKGNGRCLRLSYNPSAHTYEYTGVDCVQRSNYLCELKDRTSENEISRIAKSLKFN